MQKGKEIRESRNHLELIRVWHNAKYSIKLTWELKTATTDLQCYWTWKSSLLTNHCKIPLSSSSNVIYMEIKGYDGGLVGQLRVRRSRLWLFSHFQSLLPSVPQHPPTINYTNCLWAINFWESEAVLHHRHFFFPCRSSDLLSSFPLRNERAAFKQKHHLTPSHHLFEDNSNR